MALKKMIIMPSVFILTDMRWMLFLSVRYPELMIIYIGRRTKLLLCPSGDLMRC